MSWFRSGLLLRFYHACSRSIQYVLCCHMQMRPQNFQRSNITLFMALRYVRKIPLRLFNVGLTLRPFAYGRVTRDLGVDGVEPCSLLRHTCQEHLSKHDIYTTICRCTNGLSRVSTRRSLLRTSDRFTSSSSRCFQFVRLPLLLSLLVPMPACRSAFTWRRRRSRQCPWCWQLPCAQNTAE